MSDTFSFNRIRKDYVYSILKDVVEPVMAPRQVKMTNIPRRPGALVQGLITDARPLEVPILIKKPIGMSFPRLREDLAVWLSTEEPAELRFDYEPDRTYFALLEEVEPLEIINEDTAKTTIKFICPDPYKYSDTRVQSFPKGSQAVFNVDNLGNVDAYPISSIKIAKTLNYLKLKSDSDYFQIGAPELLGDPEPYEPEEQVFFDGMTTVGGWTQASSVDNGYVSGEMKSSGNYFYADTYGTVIQPPAWQGPSLKKSIGTALTDFKARINVHFNNKPDERTGMIEVYFLNASNEVVAKIGLEDRFAATSNILAKAGLGDVGERTWIYSGGADNPEYWNDFSGIMEIQRKGNYWTVYWTTVAPDGTHTYPRGVGGSLYYNDTNGYFSDQITQVQVAIRIHPDSVRADMGIHDITIWKLNKRPTPQTLPIIARPGDLFEIDHYKNVIRKNGQIVQGIKDFGSNFFPLKVGGNRITMEPPDAGDLTVSYRERYL